MSAPAMNGLPTCLSARGAGCVLQVAVSPAARRTAADGLHDGCLRVRLTAPPTEGRANDALLAWLAAELRLPRRSVRLLRGALSRRKQIELDAPLAQVAGWLVNVTGTHP
jgi:uncharacterized protein